MSAAPAPIPRPELLDAIAPLLELLGVDTKDVASLRVGATQVTVRLVKRGRRGRVVSGVIETRTHRVVPEPLED